MKTPGDYPLKAPAVPFRAGDTVSAEPWNTTVPKHRGHPAPCTVIKIIRGVACQSGYMVAFRDARGGCNVLDAGWLLPIQQGFGFFR